MSRELEQRAQKSWWWKKFTTSGLNGFHPFLTLLDPSHHLHHPLSYHCSLRTGTARVGTAMRGTTAMRGMTAMGGAGVCSIHMRGHALYAQRKDERHWLIFECMKGNINRIDEDVKGGCLLFVRNRVSYTGRARETSVPWQQSRLQAFSLREVCSVLVCSSVLVCTLLSYYALLRCFFLCVREYASMCAILNSAGVALHPIPTTILGQAPPEGRSILFSQQSRHRPRKSPLKKGKWGKRRRSKRDGGKLYASVCFEWMCIVLLLCYSFETCMGASAILSFFLSFFFFFLLTIKARPALKRQSAIWKGKRTCSWKRVPLLWRPAILKRLNDFHSLCVNVYEYSILLDV